MTSLALSSLRFRVGGFAASLAAVFLGATILMAFASMLDTRAGGVDATSGDALFIVATVVGGWGLVIVAFAVASTLSLSTKQRSRELALLKTVGATPKQIGRMIVSEAALVAIAAALAAIAPAVLVGRLLLELLQETGQVSPAVSYHFGSTAIVLGLGITFLAATIAAFLTARRAASVAAITSMAEASTGVARMSRKRVVAGCIFLAIGFDLAVVTATVMDGKGIDAMQTAGQASICSAVGFALLAPLLVRTVAARLAAPLRRAGASGYLAAENMRRRSSQMASAVMPIVLFTGIAAGTLTMQSIENGAPVAANASTTAADARNIETLNYVIVGIIGAFAAIILVNTLVAATIHRRDEFALLRLAGSTPHQVRWLVTLESAVQIVTGAFFGALASAFTVVPYSLARTDTLFPESALTFLALVVAAAALLTLTAATAATRRAPQTPAIEAVTL